jgi:4'-phosphopantetheinyl transferase
MSSAATGLPTSGWRYTRSRFGKPRLAECCEGLQFNLSHTRGFVTCAMAYHEIGVDVEASDRPTNFGIADRFFAPEEARLVHSAPRKEQPALFFRFWTLKEAFIKATGEGLQRPLDSFSFDFNPVRVLFHPERDERGAHNDPAAWQFFTLLPARDRPIALAVLRSRDEPVRVDAQTARAEEIAPY